MTFEQALLRVKMDGWCVLDGIIPADEVAAVRDSVSASVEKHPYLLPDNSLPPTRWNPANQNFRDMKAEIDHCRNQIEKAGMEVLAIDMTHPDIDLNVVCAV